MASLAVAGWLATAGGCAGPQRGDEGAARGTVAPAAAPEWLRLPVGTQGSDVREMLQAVRAGRRAEIAIPERFGDLELVVETQHLAARDWDGDGRPEQTLYRRVTVPDLVGQPSTASWLLAIPRPAAGEAPAEAEKRGRLLLADLRPGARPAFEPADPQPAGAGLVLRGAEGPLELKAPAPALDSAAQREQDLALVEGAGLVFDRLVLAPETAYVKAFIRQEFQAEVDRVEAVRGMAMPLVLRPVYGPLREASARLSAGLAVTAGDERLARAEATARLLQREADLALALPAAAQQERVAALAEVSKAWRAIEAGLSYQGEPLRRIDFERRLAEEPDPAARLALAQAYEGAFAPLYAPGGPFERMVATVNAMARAQGYDGFLDLRIQQIFGLDRAAFLAWVERAFAATEAPAADFIAELRRFAGKQDLGYWEVGHLQRRWLQQAVGGHALPELAEAQALQILRSHLAELGFDLSQPPYDRITMDFYQDPLKQDQAGVAATATPQDGYFTANLRPGKAIPLEEFETLLHETLHTLHYQTSGQASGGSSAQQNLMYSYVAEGVTMSGQDLPVANEALMRRYFGGLPGFDDALLERYPAAQRRAQAWDLRRLLVMALMEHELYVDRRPDGSERPWQERLAAWPQLLEQRLWVRPDGIELGQILCRMHPSSEQQQLMYASYPLGRILVGQLRDRLLGEGSPAELARYGVVLRRLMARGALADEPFVRSLLAELGG